MTGDLMVGPRTKRVWVLPADYGTCGHLRAAWPAELLQKMGFAVTVKEPGNQRLDIIVHATPDNRKVMGTLLSRPECDIIVLQRTAARDWVAAITAFQSVGIKVIVDIDDDLSALRADHEGYRSVHPRWSPNYNWEWLDRACHLADLVTVTTPRLAEKYGKHGRVRIVPNCVPAAYLDVKHVENTDGLVIGWPGTVSTHPGDLNVAGRAVRDALRAAPGTRFRVLGDIEGVQRALGLANPPEQAPWVPLKDYPKALTQLDIGIAPLAAHRFNEAKSWLKPLDMAAVGVPFVASDTGPYRELGCGVIASTQKDWDRALRRLVQSAAYRDEVRAAGYEVARHLTLEGNWVNWANAWGLSPDARMIPKPAEPQPEGAAP